jgi:cell shape-determining protein MreC
MTIGQQIMNNTLGAVNTFLDGLASKMELLDKTLAENVSLREQLNKAQVDNVLAAGSEKKDEVRDEEG